MLIKKNKSEKNIIDRFVSEKKYVYLWSFLLPIFVLICLYIIKEVHPFGDRMYLARDMYHQYAPFFSELYNKLTNGGSLTYSWNIGLGTNFTGLYAYYLASPLNWFLALINRNHLIEVMNIFIILKLALSSVTCSYYLRCKYQRSELAVLAISLFYALSSYVAAFAWNIMWLDCLMLLPLIILGLERLVKEGKGYLYFISLGLAIISNYYIAYMICIYLVLYFLVLLFTNDGDKDWQYFKSRLIKFAGFSLLAGMLAAFLIIPEYFALKASASGEINFPDTLNRYFSIYEILSRGLMNVEVSETTANDPNIYSTILIYILMPLYIMGQTKNSKEKVGKVLLVAFFLISFNFNILNYIWHGFHFPNSLPARQSFIFIFLLLTMAYEVLINLKNFKKKQIYGAFAGALLLVISYEHLLVGVVYEYHVVYLSILFLAIYLAFLQVYRGIVVEENELLDLIQQAEVDDASDSIQVDNKSEDLESIEDPGIVDDGLDSVGDDLANLENTDHNFESKEDYYANEYEFVVFKKTIVAIMFIIVATAEVLINFGTTGLSVTSRTYYLEDNEDIDALLEIVEEEDDSFYRIEKYKRRTKNDAAWHGYKSASLFSSTSSEKLNDYLDCLGFENSMNASSFYGQTPLTASLFSVKYMLAKEDDDWPFTDNSYLTSYIHGVGSEQLYRNNYTLPLGFMLPMDFDLIWNISSSNPFQVQNDFANNLVDEDLFNEMAVINNGTSVTIKAEDYRDIYIYVPTRDVESLSFQITDINGIEIETKTYDEYRREHIINLGSLEPGNYVHISSIETSNDIDVYAYTFDEDVFVDLYHELNNHTFDIEIFKDTYIKGSIYTNEAGLMYTSIPFDEGWSVKVDGYEVETLAFKDALIAIPLASGDHTIELSYTPQGLKSGIAISLFGIICFIIIVFVNRKKGIR